MPAGGVAIRGASKGSATKNQQISAALQVTIYRGPGGLWNCRALGQYQQASVRVLQLPRQLFRGGKPRLRKDLRELFAGWRCGIGRRQTGFRPDHNLREESVLEVLTVAKSRVSNAAENRERPGIGIVNSLAWLANDDPAAVIPFFQNARE